MEPTKRISRPTLFMRNAINYSMRSTCNRGNVGCVIVQGKHQVAAGYNGSPPGLPHCDEVGCDELILYERKPKQKAEDTGHWESLNLGCQRTIHAEANAIAHAARLGIQLGGGILFSTHSPCLKCAQLLGTAGIIHIVYDKKYRATPWGLLKEMSIPCTQIGDYLEY